eukprot:symbB.v1.2.041023.t1/scaffold7749.1/size9534/1
MLKTVEDAMERAKSIGFPIMVKASEGGGGKGIRKATSMEDADTPVFPEEWPRCWRRIKGSKKSLEELKVAFTNVQAEVPGSPIFLMCSCKELYKFSTIQDCPKNSRKTSKSATLSMGADGL